MIDKLTGEGGEDEEVKKIINIFNFKQRLLSIDIKTKVVQHVEHERVARGGGAGSAARPRPVDQ